MIPSFDKALWCKESKLVRNGQLIPLYHGSCADFTEFDNSQLCSNECWDEEEHRVLGHFLTTQLSAARLYAVDGFLYRSYVYSVHPLEVFFQDRNDFVRFDKEAVLSLQRKMKLGGYDSLKVVDGTASDIWYIIPRAEQIKVVRKERLYLNKGRQEVVFDFTGEGTTP